MTINTNAKLTVLTVLLTLLGFIGSAFAGTLPEPPNIKPPEKPAHTIWIEGEMPARTNIRNSSNKNAYAGEHLMLQSGVKPGPEGHFADYEFIVRRPGGEAYSQFMACTIEARQVDNHGNILPAACRGAYEEGIRNIFAWSYKGSKWMSKLACDNPDLVWQMLGGEYKKMIKSEKSNAEKNYRDQKR